MSMQRLRTVAGHCARMFCILAPLCAAWPAHAAGSEVYPGDFVALPSGTQVLSFYQYKRDFEGYYFNGERVGGARAKARASVAAYTRYGQIGNMTSAWSVTLPYFDVHKTAGTFPVWFGDATSGMSDLRLKYSVWPVNDPAQGRYVALTGIWQPDTGRYERNQVLSPGDNRNRLTFQLTWIEPLSKTVSLELTPEFSWQSDNNDYVGTHMEQENAYALTGYLRWRFAGPWSASVGFQSNRGGDQIIDGVRQHNEPDQQRVLFSVNTMLAPDVAASLRYSHDTSVQNSVRIVSDWVLAVHWLF
ncbi:MAG TPA: transporter [Oxalicibacterium sp.]|nr:transporter [Oxalicibacterium sp.]